jgi:hypothetical protein
VCIGVRRRTFTEGVEDGDQLAPGRAPPALGGVMARVRVLDVANLEAVVDHVVIPQIVAVLGRISAGMFDRKQ